MCSDACSYAFSQEGGSSPILECEALVKKYGEITALDSISFSLPRGRIIGLLGPNGSGKTTFIKICAGLLSPSGGEVRISGMEISEKTKALVAYLPERNSIPEYFTVNDAVDFYSDFFLDFDRSRADLMLDSLCVDRKRKIKSLSKGTKEKVQLILVMSRRAELYLLDEPISGVDPAARDFIIGTVIRNFDPSATVVISTHLISDIERIMDGFIFIRDGKIVYLGTPSELLLKTGMTVDAYFREVFRC